jgi:hypothetical protein
MDSKILNVVSKILFGVFIVGTFVSLIFLMLKQDSKRNSLYRVDFDEHRIWTEKVVKTEDGGVEFTDVESKRKFVVYGNYAVIDPKSK